MPSLLARKLQTLFMKQFCYKIHIKHFLQRLFVIRPELDMDQSRPGTAFAIAMLKACAAV